LFSPTVYSDSANIDSIISSLRSAAEDNKEKSNSTIKNNLGTVISSALNIFKGYSVEQEVLIGKTISARLMDSAPLVKNDRLQYYVNHVGRWVASHSERTDIEWHFGVLDSEKLNAFAAPGGYILITKGLYRQLNSEAELAAVLGHEIGHVLKKHHLSILKKSSWMELGRVLAEHKLGGNNKLIDNLIGSGAEFMARSLDKSAEYEADRVGIVLASRAGYNGYALPIVLQDIGHASTQKADVSLWFKTHPHPNDRLEQLSSAMSQYSDSGLMLEKRFYRLR